MVKITSKLQFLTLITDLQKNPDLAKGMTNSFDKDLFKTNWDEITNHLNALGPPTRDTDGWQKVWADYKGKVKKKLAHNKKEMKATGGGQNRDPNAHEHIE